MAAKPSPLALISDGPFLAGALLCAIVIGGTGWLLLIRTPTKPPRPAAQSYTHKHCPVCQLEVQYTPDTEPVVYEKCQSEVRYVPTIGSIHGSDDRKLGSKVTFGLITLIMLQGLLLLAAWRRRVLGRRAEAEQHRRLAVLCPFCERKVVYRASRAGTPHVCSRCKTAFALPEAEAAESA